MKDIEKIKSEDLAAQVQDANPANFAIEQEVAALVGATVPQPTEPSADDARELGAQLLVFLRRALLPIRSALRTAVAAIYAHLDSRCTAYTTAAYAPYIPRPYDPMGTPPTPRSVANLLTAITAFSARKISNGSAPNDGIPDGMSLARLLCADYANVVELKDDTHGWIYSRNSLAQFPNAKKITLGFKSSDITIISGHQNVEELVMTDAEVISRNQMSYTFISNCPKLKKIDGKAFKRFSSSNGTMMISDCAALEEIDFRNSAYIATYVNIALIYNCPSLRRIIIGTTGTNPYNSTTDNLFGQAAFQASSTDNLIDIELGEGFAYSLNLCQWNPTNVLSDADKTATFLQNFREHIALRLTANGSGKTLTLSQAVRDAIHAAEATYGIEAIIVTQKGWTLSPAPTA